MSRTRKRNGPMCRCLTCNVEFQSAFKDKPQKCCGSYDCTKKQQRNKVREGMKKVRESMEKRGFKPNQKLLSTNGVDE